MPDQLEARKVHECDDDSRHGRKTEKQHRQGDPGFFPSDVFNAAFFHIWAAPSSTPERLGSGPV